MVERRARKRKVNKKMSMQEDTGGGNVSNVGEKDSQC